MSLTLIGNKNV